MFKKLPSFIILKIITINYSELLKYRYIFTNSIIKNGLQKLINTDLFKLKHLYKEFRNININYENECLKKTLLIVELQGIKEVIDIITTNDIQVFKILVKINNAVVYKYMVSSNIEIVKYCIKKGATNYNECLSSSNIDVVNLGIKMGANRFNKCLNSSNIEVVKLGIMKGATKFYRCLGSNNIEIVKLGINMGATNYFWCFLTKNIDILLYACYLKKKIENFL